MAMNLQRYSTHDLPKRRKLIDMTQEHIVQVEETRDEMGGALFRHECSE